MDFDGVDIRLWITFAATADTPSVIEDNNPNSENEMFDAVVRDMEDDMDEYDEGFAIEEMHGESATGSKTIGSKTAASKSTNRRADCFADDEEVMAEFQLFTVDERKQIFLSLREADEILYDLRNILDGRLQDLEVKRHLSVFQNANAPGATMENG